MKWRPTKMGYYIGGKMQADGAIPISLLTLSRHLSLGAKIRYRGCRCSYTTKRNRTFDAHRAPDIAQGNGSTRWIGAANVYRRRCGSRLFAFEILRIWRMIFLGLLDLDTRVKRIGNSRKSI